MYYIKQTEGKLADAAEAIRAAVKTGDFEKAREIYESTTHKLVDIKPTERELWMRYNAAHQIVCQNGLTVDDCHLLYERYGDEEQRAKAAARLAEHKVGGKWVAEYTY